MNRQKRNELKGMLYGEFPYCALSKKHTNRLEMHEWLVKRSDLPILRIQDKIFSIYNCILLSPEQHSRTDGMRRDWECARWAIQEYTIEAIGLWLLSLNLRTFGGFGQWIQRIESKLNIPEEESLIGNNIQVK